MKFFISIPDFTVLIYYGTQDKPTKKIPTSAYGREVKIKASNWGRGVCNRLIVAEGYVLNATGMQKSADLVC